MESVILVEGAISELLRRLPKDNKKTELIF